MRVIVYRRRMFFNVFKIVKGKVDLFLIIFKENIMVLVQWVLFFEYFCMYDNLNYVKFIDFIFLCFIYIRIYIQICVYICIFGRYIYMNYYFNILYKL